MSNMSNATIRFSSLATATINDSNERAPAIAFTSCVPAMVRATLIARIEETLRCNAARLEL